MLLKKTIDKQISVSIKIIYARPPEERQPCEELHKTNLGYYTQKQENCIFSLPTLIFIK